MIVRTKFRYFDRLCSVLWDFLIFLIQTDQVVNLDIRNPSSLKTLRQTFPTRCSGNSSAKLPFLSWTRRLSRNVQRPPHDRCISCFTSAHIHKMSAWRKIPPRHPSLELFTILVNRFILPPLDMPDHHPHALDDLPVSSLIYH